MADRIGALSFISEVSGKKRIYIVWLLIVQVVLGLSGVCYAMILRDVIDAAAAGEREGFIRCMFLLAGLVVFQLGLRAVVRSLEEYARSSYENLFKERLFGRLLTKDYQRVTAIHSGEWMNRLTSDTAVVADGLATIVPGIAGMTVKMLGALCMILYMEPMFGFVLVPGGLLLVALTYGFRRALKGLHKRMQEQDGRVRTFLQEYLESMVVVRAFGVEQESIDEAGKRMREHQRARMKKNHFSNVCNIGFGAAMNGAYVLGVAYCGYGLLLGRITYGTLMAMLQLISQVQNPFANITGYLPKYYAMLASAERLMEAEELEAAKGNSKSGFERICMSHVSFSYEKEREVLDDFSMEIRKGEFVAFTGASGCGKSTVLRLLLGLYEPEQGTVEPVSRGVYAYVPQGNYLMSDTIRGVVSLSDKAGAYDEDRLKKALEAACAEFVFELPEGLDTVLGEKGAGLSEGQMQRIAIARAVFADRPVLVLDEATSALDEATEKRLLERLRTMTDRTVIIVTHRPAALAVCDRRIEF